jgi:hypothetical protein
MPNVSAASAVVAAQRAGRPDFDMQAEDASLMDNSPMLLPEQAASAREQRSHRSSMCTLCHAL